MKRNENTVIDIAALDLPRRICAILRDNGINSCTDLVAHCRREIRSLPRLGDKSVDVIEAGLARLSLGLAEDRFSPYTCARHNQPRGDASLSSMFLCDNCATLFQDNGFRGKKPEYMGDLVKGYCLHCNKLLDSVRLYQWFLCGNCYRVVKSIGRSVAAVAYVEGWWRNHVRCEFPHLRLELTDPPEIRSYSVEDGDHQESDIDFICIDEKQGKPVFGIELKAGRNRLKGGSIGTAMTQFQLDHSDCDDLLRALRQRQIPGYVFHAQVIDRAYPPTSFYTAVGLWWTDLCLMSENFKETKQRPNENRPAAYFHPRMFSDLDSYIEHLRQNGMTTLIQKFASEGFPQLYRSS